MGLPFFVPSAAIGFVGWRQTLNIKIDIDYSAFVHYTPPMLTVSVSSVLRTSLSYLFDLLSLQNINLHSALWNVSLHLLL